MSIFPVSPYRGQDVTEFALTIEFGKAEVDVALLAFGVGLVASMFRSGR